MSSLTLDVSGRGRGSSGALGHRFGDSARAWVDRAGAEGRAAYERGLARSRTAEGLFPSREDDLREAQETVRALQARNRARWWERCLSGVYADYAAAAVETLTPDQDPGGRVSGWLESGSRTLLIAGENSRGKTWSAFAVGNQAAAVAPLPMWVVAWNSADLDAALRPSSPNCDKVMEHASECDLLILDDLGAEKVTEWTLEQLYRIVDARVRNRRRLVVTTNLPYDERGFSGSTAPAGPVTPNLVGRYGHRITERLIHEATMVRVTGPSWRRPVPF